MIDPLHFPTPENLIRRLSARHNETQCSILGNGVSIFGEAADRIQYLEYRNKEIMTRWKHSQTWWIDQIKKLRARLNNRNIEVYWLKDSIAMKNVSRLGAIIERARAAAKAMEDGQFRSELECAEMIHQALKEK